MLHKNRCGRNIYFLSFQEIQSNGIQPRKTSSSKIGQIFESLHALATVGLFTEEEESNDKWNALAVDKLCR